MSTDRCHVSHCWLNKVLMISLSAVFVLVQIFVSPQAFVPFWVVPTFLNWSLPPVLVNPLSHYSICSLFLSICLRMCVFCFHLFIFSLNFCFLVSHMFCSFGSTSRSRLFSHTLLDKAKYLDPDEDEEH